MEPLQEAIERARLQREGLIGQTSAPGQKKPQHGISGHPAREPAPVPQDALIKSRKDDLPLPSEVHYSATRRIEPSEVRLLHNRVIAGQIHDPRVEAYRQLRSQVLAK